MTRHQRVKHSGIRPWNCEYCGVSYARSDLLTRHKRKCKSKSSVRHPSKPPFTPISSSAFQVSNSITSPTSQAKVSYDDTQPPSYQQAISFNSRPISSIKAASLPQFSSFPEEVIVSPSNTVSSTGHQIPHQTLTEEILATESLAPNTIPPTKSPFDFNLKISDDSHYPDRLQLEGSSLVLQKQGPQTMGQIDEEAHDHHEEIIEATPVLGSPTDHQVKYLQQSFFISDVPESSPFYLNPNIWVLAFLCQRSQGFTIPHIGSLSRFVSRATEVVCPVIPMIHVPTLRTSLISIHLGYALSVAGAASESSDYALAFTEQSLSYKRPLVQNDFICRERSFTFRFELFQALLTYQFLSMFSRSEVQRDRARNFNRTIIENFRDLDFIQVLRRSPDYIQLALSGQISLELGWKLWINYEVQKRTAFLVLISSLQLGSLPGYELKLPEADLPLPCHEDLWLARNAKEWAEAARNHDMKYFFDNTNVIGACPTDTKMTEPALGEQSIPTLSEALAALVLTDYSTDESKQIPDISRVGLTRLTLRAERLGRFARTVIRHTGALAHQATVSPRVFGPSQ